MLVCVSDCSGCVYSHSARLCFLVVFCMFLRGFLFVHPECESMLCNEFVFVWLLCCGLLVSVCSCLFGSVFCCCNVVGVCVNRRIVRFCIAFPWIIDGIYIFVQMCMQS